MGEGGEPDLVLSSSIPAAAGLEVRVQRAGIEVLTLQPLGEGEFSRAYLLNGTLVLREAKHREAARALEREACLMSRLRPNLPVSVPHPRCLPPRQVQDPVLTLHALVPGTPLTRSRWLAFPKAERTRLARSLGAFLGALHHIGVEAATGCSVPLVDHLGQAAGLREELRDSPAAVLPGPLRERIAHALAEAGSKSRGEGACRVLLHGDVSPEHVLVEEGAAHLSGVIDWGDLHLGDPAFDFIYLYEDWGSAFLELALAGYPGVPGPGFRRRILLHYLVEHLAWTLEALEREPAAALSEGIQGLERVLGDLEGDAAP